MIELQFSLKNSRLKITRKHSILQLEAKFESMQCTYVCSAMVYGEGLVAGLPRDACKDDG